jgi:hypothetical protein
MTIKKLKIAMKVHLVHFLVLTCCHIPDMFPSHKITSGRCTKLNGNFQFVTLRVVGGDEMGSLKSETVKYGHKSQGTWSRERLR